MLSKRQINKNHQKNLFLNPKLHTEFEDTLELHQFSDSGRIANRYDSMRWDAWTTMGENVLEYNGVLFDEDDSYSEREDECSLSEDDFLEIPFNDRTACKHWWLYKALII